MSYLWAEHFYLWAVVAEVGGFLLQIPTFTIFSINFFYIPLELAEASVIAHVKYFSMVADPGK